jgi:ribosome biogenesis GTPase
MNKADLVEDHAKYRTEIAQLMRDCPVYFCSTYSGLGIDELKNNVLQKGKTYIFVGSSGVGKSSLLNSFMQKELQKTDSTSDVTSKGKHTTTTRDLFELPNGSLVIDSPGMREFGLTFEEGQHADELFPAIEKFASTCRFTDCRHVQEAGCAVMEAVKSGALDENVYESYLKLLKEQRRFEIKIEDKKRLGKQFGKMTKEAKAYRKKYKY